MRLSDIASLGIAAAQDVMSSAGESTAESNLYMKILPYAKSEDPLLYTVLLLRS